LETRFVKNVKWIAGKRGFRNIVLHSFTHLAEASASPQFAEAFLQSAAQRLRSTGYRVTLTPFGNVIVFLPIRDIYKPQSCQLGPV
jgi:CRP-like cAMP-binding protein